MKLFFIFLFSTLAFNVTAQSKKIRMQLAKVQEYLDPEDVSFLIKHQKFINGDAANYLAHYFVHENDTLNALAHKKWNHKACNLGNVEAMLNRGQEYLVGRFEVVDTNKAMYWFGMAAERDAFAKTELAIHLLEGNFGFKNTDSAFALLKLAAEQKEEKALYILMELLRLDFYYNSKKPSFLNSDFIEALTGYKALPIRTAENRTSIWVPKGACMKSMIIEQLKPIANEIKNNNDRSFLNVGSPNGDRYCSIQKSWDDIFYITKLLSNNFGIAKGSMAFIFNSTNTKFVELSLLQIAPTELLGNFPAPPFPGFSRWFGNNYLYNTDNIITS